MLRNDGELQYEMGLSVDDSVMIFFNLPRNVFYFNDAGFENTKIIQFQLESVFAIKCRQVRAMLHGDNNNNYLREIYDRSTSSGTLYHNEFDVLVWSKLSNFTFNSSTLDWPDDYKIVH